MSWRERQGRGKLKDLVARLEQLQRDMALRERALLAQINEVKKENARLHQHFCNLQAYVTGGQIETRLQELKNAVATLANEHAARGIEYDNIRQFLARVIDVVRARQPPVEVQLPRPPSPKRFDWYDPSTWSDAR